MNIFYTLHDKLYVNITNRCSCACIFCIRKGSEGHGSADSLWLPHEPLLPEIKAAFDFERGQGGLDGMTEIVFCGFGEPMERADLVLECCEYFKAHSDLPIRLNTNGLVKLIHPDFDMARLSCFNSVSVSLNADDEAEYLRVTRPGFNADKLVQSPYAAMLSFAETAKKYTAVSFTVVDVIGDERIENCRKISRDMDIPLKIRHFITD
ncbi:MAG: TatD family nuclease-associated radical SAM protein [Oscillospiraceae bacterium]|nr:TatD family nuclease-associated radical SAM protein [Oscillospiraceae bacterium]